MDFEQLVVAGLTEPQAKAYALLFEAGEIKPPDAAAKLNITRTNAYKLFDRLEEMGLAQKKEVGKKFVYRPNNPMALTELAASLRSEAMARENAVNNLMKNLLNKYYQHVEQPAVQVVSGRQAVADAYRNQIGLKEDIYFIHSPADISVMGFDNMHGIRTAPTTYGLERHGILTDPVNVQVNPESHKRASLHVTWAESGLYDAPVEWSVTQSSLLIVLFGSEPHAITISNPLVAGSFLQLWHMLSGLLRNQMTHKQMNKKR